MPAPKAKVSRSGLVRAKNSRKAARDYTREALRDACARKDEHPDLDYGVVAQEFSIPRSTLHDHHRGIHTPAREAHAKQQRLTPESELALIDWLEHLSEMGCPVDKRTIIDMVIVLSGNPTPPNRKWIGRFLDRHPEVVLGKPSGLDPKRAQAFNRTVVDDHFKKLQALIEEYEIPWEHVYNMDEKGVQRGGGRRLQNIKYFVPRGRRPKYKLRSSNLELVTIIECVCADGSSIQPGIVFSGKEFSRRWFQYVDPRIKVSMSPNGWTDDRLCAEWFEKSFVPQTAAHRVSQAPILLIVDGHGSHVTPKMRKIAEENKIHIFCLPPHTTHRLQPLDVGVFGPLQTAWQNRCNEYYATSGGHEMERSEFIREYMDVRNAKFTPDLIKKAWRKSGITSETFSADFFSDEDFAPSLQTSTQAHVPPLFPSNNPLFPENAFVPPQAPEASVSTAASVSTSNNPFTSDPPTVAAAAPSHTSNAPSSSQPLNPDNESDGEEQVASRAIPGVDSDDESDGWEELEGASGGDNVQTAHGEPAEPPTPGSLDRNPPVVNSAVLTRIRARLPGTRASHSHQVPRTNMTIHAVSDSENDASHSEPDDPETTAQLQAALVRVRQLEESNRELLSYARFAEANCKLANRHIDTLQKQLNHKRARKAGGRSRTIHINARCITTGEGARQCAEEEAARAAEEKDKEDKRTKKDQEAKTRQVERERMKTDDSFAFTGSLKSKNKPELQDIAYVLGLPLGGNKADILETVTQFFDTNPDFKAKDKYSGLFTGRKRALPADLQDENAPPPSQRPRVEQDPCSSITGSTPGPSTFGDHGSINTILTPYGPPGGPTFGSYGTTAMEASASTSRARYPPPLGHSSSTFSYHQPQPFTPLRSMLPHYPFHSRPQADHTHFEVQCPHTPSRLQNISLVTPSSRTNASPHPNTHE